jgi:hypothetical protein
MYRITAGHIVRAHHQESFARVRMRAILLAHIDRAQQKITSSGHASSTPALHTGLHHNGPAQHYDGMVI